MKSALRCPETPRGSHFLLRLLSTVTRELLQPGSRKGSGFGAAVCWVPGPSLCRRLARPEAWGGAVFSTCVESRKRVCEALISTEAAAAGTGWWGWPSSRGAAWAGVWHPVPRPP